MKYGYTNSTGGTSIDSSAVFCAVLNNRDPLLIGDFNGFLKDCETLVHTEFSPTQGAINNVRGNWYEWLISVGALNFLENKEPKLNTILLPLPNVSSLDYNSLYVDEVYSFISDLKHKTAKHDVSLISSNPDYAIVTLVDGISVPNTLTVTPDTISKIDQLYKSFDGRLQFDDLIGFASIKTSLRPDRRLQLSHEGALVKAFYEHLKARLWKVDAQGLKYYGVSMVVKNSDKTGLKTVATHSILSVNSTPERAVDDVVQISSGNDLTRFLTLILS